jgi:photoactive yellow protein
MADATNSDSPNDASSPNRDQDWYARHWDTLCDELGTSDPTEVLARVQAMKRQINQAQSAEQDAEEEGLVTISEVEEVFREMNQKVEKLRERNTALVERLEREGEEMEGPVRDLHQNTEQLLDSLDAATMDEARERIQTLNQRLEDLYQEKEQLAQAGLSDAEAALNEIDQLREERDALRRERDRLQADRNQLEQQLAATDEPEPADREATAAVRDRIGVATPDQADVFVQLVEQLYELSRDRAAAHDAEVDDAPDDAVEMLHSMAAHLDALPDPEDTDDALPAEAGEILGIRTVEEARELDDLIADMSSRLERLSQEQETLEAAGLTADVALGMIENMEAQLDDLYHGSEPALNGTHDALDEAGLDADEAVAMIESMEVQLNDLYRSLEEEGNAAERLAAIEDVLGISTRKEAEELSEIARQMEEQLTTLYEDKQKLQDLGLESIGDAVDMIENMENQLTDLYEDREALRSIQTAGDTDDQSTFQQLEALYAERERLQQALGVSSADEIIELVESLNTQLDELYKGRDAEVAPEERHDVLLWEPDESEEPPSTDDSSSPETSTTLTMSSMEHQLEALYREKETLLHHGFTNAQEAVSQLHIQQKQIDALQRENHTYEQRFERLQSELGTAKVPQLVKMVRALESETGTSLDDVLDTTPEPSDGPEYGLDIEAASPFVDDETLDRLGEMEPAELDDLDVGVVRLSDDGTVEYLNEAALQLPGLSSTEDRSAAVGENFFLDLAPSTKNNLFYGRFQNGQRRGEMDARFPYTFTSPDEGPRPFAVHLHRKPDGEATWLLYRPS